MPGRAAASQHLNRSSLLPLLRPCRPACPPTHLGEAVQDAADWGGVKEGDWGTHEAGEGAVVDDTRGPQRRQQVAGGTNHRQKREACRWRDKGRRVGGWVCG